MIILIYKISIAIRPSVLLNICLTSVDFRLYYNVQAIKQFAVEKCIPTISLSRNAFLIYMNNFMLYDNL